MRILIINELAVGGGTEVQTLREWEYFIKMGHDVYVLTFDGKLPGKRNGRKLNCPFRCNLAHKAIIRAFGSREHRQAIEEVIRQVSPEVIHLNNIINLPKDVYHCIEGIPAIQTIRDYSAVCPKGTCIKKDGSACKGYLHGNCKKCAGLSIEMYYRLWTLRHYNEVKKQAVAKFFSPSQALADKCSENGLPTSCLNNPFDWTKLQGKSKSFGKKKIFLYYGFIAEHKGIVKLFDAFSRFSEIYEAELWLAGEVYHRFEKKFKGLMQAGYAKYLGVLTYPEIMAMYHRIYCVIVPSLWLENYPNTVLEAIANKTLVIGSNRGGIPELIQDDRFCFDILNQQAFVECLKMCYELKPEEYQCVAEKAYERIKMNNSQEKYYEHLMGIYHSLLQSKNQADDAQERAY